ncbi:MAG TPA: HD domain-containing protein [Anaerolineae bacterium]|nr:HD domain-containing protein [Anaerolineae bacterium]
MTIDFEAAKKYVIDRLERELSPLLVYHSLWHTTDDVVLATIRLADLENVQGEDRVLLLTAAFYHDIGFLKIRVGHEDASIQMAREALPQYGYLPRQIDIIAGIIHATQLPQSPRNLLEQILADADLDALGREDFFVRNQLLRQELENYGIPATEDEWDEIQLSFLESHHYFTRSAITLRGPGQSQHISILADRIRRRGGHPISDSL